MKVAFFNTHAFEKPYFVSGNQNYDQSITFLEPKLNEQTVELARGHDCVCSFVYDHLNANVLNQLKEMGIRLIALRSAGFNHVDMQAAADLELPIVRVPEYSPYAVAEHAVALILSLNRKIYQSISRVRENNFSLDGLVGFDLHNKTVGIVGTGKIGSVMAKIMKGFGCRILAYDIAPNAELAMNLGIEYVEFPHLLRDSDIVTLHVPLTPKTHHMIDMPAFVQMKSKVMLINTGRGGLVDTKALIQALKNERIGYAGLDVYEEEEGIFFENLSGRVQQDDQLARLMTFPNVLITSHQAFLTHEALRNISQTTLQNILDFEQGRKLFNQVHAETHVEKEIRK
jgi:D-lactate dehydrogenase